MVILASDKGDGNAAASRYAAGRIHPLALMLTPLR